MRPEAGPLVTETAEGRSEIPAATLVVDVGATRTRLAIVRDGAICSRSERRTAELVRGGDIVGGLVDEARTLVARHGAMTVGAIGVGLAAFVDEAGDVLQARDFGIPSGDRLRVALEAAFGVPVAVDNDANLAALAEHRLGAAVGRQSVALLTLGTNIGLGLILDGRIHRGAHGAAGEAGLVLVTARETGERSGDGRVVDAGPLGIAVSRGPRPYAWIEELVGGGALAAAAAGPLAASGATGDAGGQAPDRGVVPTPPQRVLTARAHAEPALRRLADRAVEGWALLISILSAILDPELVILSGGLAEDAAHLLDPLRRRVGELAPIPPEIRLGQLGADAELLGAHLLARSALESRAVGHARAGLAARSRGGDR